MLVNYVNPTSNIYNAKTVYVIIEDGSDVNPNPNPTENKAVLTRSDAGVFTATLTQGTATGSDDLTGATVKLQKSYDGVHFDDGIAMNGSSSSTYPATPTFAGAVTYYVRAEVTPVNGTPFYSNTIIVIP